MPHLNRRTFLSHAAAVSAGLALSTRPSHAADKPMRIIDTHQHLWELPQQKLLWLEGAPEVLKHSFTNDDYLKATAGLNVDAIYMEVDVAPEQHDDEVERIVKLAASKKVPTMAGVVGGRPAEPGFPDRVKKLKQISVVKGVRQVLHNEANKRGQCLEPDFVNGVRALGKHGLSFDLCMRPTELVDALKLTEHCPDTRFVLDHCGNADPKAFAKLSDEKPWHNADDWRRSIELLAERPNVICKISGIIARAPRGWKAEHLAPIVNHCLDSFGPDRVVFGGDWPVCLLGGSLRSWIDALTEIISTRPAAERERLWSANAVKFYNLT